MLRPDPYFFLLCLIKTTSQFIMNIPRNTEKNIRENLFSRKPEKSKMKAKNMPAKETMKIVFSLAFIS